MLPKLRKEDNSTQVISPVSSRVTILKSFLKYYKVLILCLTSILIFSTPARATHMMGADITYRCIDTLKFEITIKLYRDCRGISLSNPSSGSGIRCASGGNASLNLTLTNIKEITPVCASVTGNCDSNRSSTGEGIEQHTYKAIVDFNQTPYSGVAGNCCKVIIYTGQSARNSAINTGAANQYFYTYAEIDLCKAPCNSSPALTSEPIGILCCNQPFFYNNGASDTLDFDSLSYSWAQPLRGWNQNIGYSGTYYAYNHPFSAYYPGNLAPPYKNCGAATPIGICLDEETGDIILTPTRCDEVTVAVIEITEWRKDSTGTYRVIGVTRRDMQFITESCPDNNPPEIDGPYSYEVCAGSQLCFNVTTDDQTFVPPPPASTPPPDTVRISWNRGIPGATFTVINPTALHQTGRFCWTPGLDDASDLPYSFTVTARDNACPRNAVAVRSFRVKVKPRALAERNVDTLPCGVYAFESIPIAGFKGVPSYRWQILDTNRNIVFDNEIAKFYSTGSFLSVKQADTILFRRGGTYIIQHTINNSPQNCPTTFYDTLIVPPLLEANLSLGKDTFICAGTLLKLDPYISNATPPISFQWSTMGVEDDGTPLNNVTSNVGDTLDHFELSLPEDRYDTAVSILITDASGCSSTDTVQVFLRQNPTVELPDDPRICTYDSIQLVAEYDTAYWIDRLNSDTLRQGDTLYKHWFLNSAAVPFSIADSVVVHLAGAYELRVTDPYGCYDVDTLILNVNDTVRADAGPDRVICFNDTIVLRAQGLDTAGNGKSGVYTWYNITDFPKTNVTTDDTIELVGDTDVEHELYLRVNEGGVQCEDYDSVLVTVNPLPVIDLKNDFAVCCGDGDVSLTLNGLASTDPKGGVWTVEDEPNWVTGQVFHADSACSLNTNPVTLTYTYQDPVTTCINSNDIIITVNPLPEIEFREKRFCQDIGEFKLSTELLRRPTAAGINLGTPSWECVECNGNDFSQMLVNKGSAIPNYWLDISESNYTIQNDQIDTVILEFTFRNQFGCFKRDTVSFEIWRVPKIKFEDGRDLCWDEGEIDLNELFDVNWTDGYWTTPATAGYRDSTTLGGLTDSSMINTLNSVELNPGQTPNRFYLRYHHNSTGCYAFNDTTLLINPLPIVNITDPVDNSKYCNTNDAVDLVATPAGGSWSSTDPASISGSTFNPQNATILNSAIWIYYDYTNPNTTCKASDSISVSVEPQPIVSIDPIAPFCRDKNSMSTSLDIVANIENADPTDLSWTSLAIQPRAGQTVSHTVNGSSITATLNMTNDSTNKFYFYVTTQAGQECSAADDYIEVEVYPVPDITIEPTNPNGCSPVETDFELVTYNAVDPTHPNTLYEWSLDDLNTSTVPNPLFEYRLAGTNDVSLKFTSEYGCDTTVFTSVDVYPNPDAEFTPDPNNFTTAALPRFKFTDESEVSEELGSVIDTWSWDFGSPFSDPLNSTQQDPTVFYNTDTATYTVKLVVETNYGCKDSTTKEVVVGPDLIVYIPNAFTPNGFGPDVNDDFRPIISGEKSMEMIIFNRWGEIMFQTDDKEEQWDGRYKGEECQQDVYAYQLKVTALNDEVYTYTGTITLIR